MSSEGQCHQKVKVNVSQVADNILTEEKMRVQYIPSL